jgi:hypothetical protein
MKELFFAELRRFRLAALIFAAAHLLLQLVLGRIANVLEMRWEKHLTILALFMVSGLALGLYQFGVYRQPGRWIWLLHRPLPRVRIFTAIGGASALLIVLAVGLPALAVLLCTKWYTACVVDLRHYALVAHLVSFTLIGWLAGVIIILSRTRMAVAFLALPIVMLGHLASGFVMLVPAAACIALLAVVAYGAFQPDRLAPPGGPLIMCATALPLQIGFYVALAFGVNILYQTALMALGAHPISNAERNEGGFYALLHKPSQKVLDDALAQSGDPRAPQWRTELARRKASFIMPLGRQFPARHQASNLDLITWGDPERAILWTFSHDEMRFHGRDVRTGADRGWFGLHGAGDTQPFPGVPVKPRQDWIMTPQQLYWIGFGNPTTRQLVGLSGSEVLAAPVRTVPGGRDYTLTNQRLIAHPSTLQDRGTGLLPIDWSVALPGPFSDLARIDIADLPGGTLLSFDYGFAMNDGAPGSAQTVMFVAPDGSAQVIEQRALAHEYPQLYEHFAWWVSPLLDVVTSVPKMVLDKGVVPDLGDPHHTAALRYPRPPQVVLAAVLLALLSALAAHRWLQPVRLPARARAAWLAACLVLGLPALLSLMVLQPRPARAKVPAAAQAATA